jgi:hypothetical protein
MGQTNWYGEAIFATTAQRDEAAAAIEDYVDATLNVEPYENDQGYAAGVVKLTTLHIDDQQGPALRYSESVSDDSVQAFGDIIMSKLNDVSLAGSNGQGPVT